LEGTVSELRRPEPAEFELEYSVSVMVLGCGISLEVQPIKSLGKTAAFEKVPVETAFSECTIFAEYICGFGTTSTDEVDVNETAVGNPTGFEVTVSDAITVA
jgi:hypothetical protein